MSALLKNYENQIETLTLIPSDGGRFEIEVNGDLLFSKLKSNRHTDSGEILKLFREHS
jgi:selenoprotein W-related protein